VTREERLALIDKLQRDAGEGRQRLAERVAKREADPAAMQDWLMADSDEIVHKEYAPEIIAADEAQAGWEAWLRASLTIERAEILDTVTQALGEVIAAIRNEHEAALIERDRKIANLEGELREMKGMLGATLQLLGQKSSKLWRPGDA